MVVKSELSEKFIKELSKFIEWANNSQYEVRDVVDDEKIMWNMNLLEKFNEPGRNKLECYLSEVAKWYNLYEIKDKQFVEVSNIKIIMIDFKNNKNNKREQKKENRKNQKVTNAIETDLIKKDDKINTNDMIYIDTLDNIKTDDLIKILGNPIKTGNEEDKHRYEWKITINNTQYSIYDWCNDNNIFDELLNCEWYVATKETTNCVSYKNDIKLLKKFIKNNIKVEVEDTQDCDEQLEFEEVDVDQLELLENLDLLDIDVDNLLNY